MRIGGADVVSRLQQCCDDEAPAVIISLAAMAVCKARFASLTKMGDSILIEFVDTPPVEFEPLSLCCVSYVQAGRGWLFVTSVREFWHGNDNERTQLALRMPESLIATEARQSLRVPVLPESGLGVTVVGPDGPLVGVKPVDISLGGSDRSMAHFTRSCGSFGRELPPVFSVGRNSGTRRTSATTPRPDARR